MVHHRFLSPRWWWVPANARLIHPCFIRMRKGRLDKASGLPGCVCVSGCNYFHLVLDFNVSLSVEGYSGWCSYWNVSRAFLRNWASSDCRYSLRTSQFWRCFTLKMEYRGTFLFLLDLFPSNQGKAKPINKQFLLPIGARGMWTLSQVADLVLSHLTYSSR